jgi:hypothetical protein
MISPEICERCNFADVSGLGKDMNPGPLVTWVGAILRTKSHQRVFADQSLCHGSYCVKKRCQRSIEKDVRISRDVQVQAEDHGEIGHSWQELSPSGIDVSTAAARTLRVSNSKDEQ